MNQFKKAKEKTLLAGQKIEKVSDLRKAGIEVEKNAEIAESIQKEKDNISRSANQTVETKINNPEIIDIELPAKTLDIIPKEEKIPEIINNNKEIQALENETIQEPIIKPTISKIQKQAEIENSIPIPVSLQPSLINSIEPVEVKKFEPIQNPIATKVQEERVVQKKKMPNIFAPKEEAKSMRKSLVLKPTSVKKAESYCSKNGGSFNELVQTLLDNFIDEYGL